MKKTSIQTWILGMTAVVAVSACGGTKYSLTRSITSPAPGRIASNVQPSPQGHQFGYWQETFPYSIESPQSWQNWIPHGRLPEESRNVEGHGLSTPTLAIGLGDREADIASTERHASSPSTPLTHATRVNLVTQEHKRCVDISETPEVLRTSALHDAQGNALLPGEQRRIQDLLDSPAGSQIRPFSQVTPARGVSNILCFNLTQPIESRIGLVFDWQPDFIHLNVIGSTVDLLLPRSPAVERIDGRVYNIEKDIAFKVSARLAPTQDFAGYFQQSLQDRSAKLLVSGPYGHPIGTTCGLERVQYVRFKLNYSRTAQGVESYVVSNAQAITLTRFQSIERDFSTIPEATVNTSNGPYRLNLAPYVSGNSGAPNQSQTACAQQFEARAMCSRFLTGEARVTCAPDYLNVLRQNYGGLLMHRALDPEHNRSFFDFQILKVE